MSIVPITTASDLALSDYRDLTDVALRSRVEPSLGIYIAEGHAIIGRAIEAGHEPRSFLCSARWLGSIEPLAALWPEVPVLLAESAILEEIAGFHVHRGALAAMQRPELPLVSDVLSGAQRIAIVEDVMNHTNVGAIFRSAAAMGIDGVLVSPRCADPLYRRSVRVSMGTVFQVPWTRLDPWPAGLENVRTAGFTIAALALDPTAVSLGVIESRPPERLAWLLGTEGDGLSRGALEGSDVTVTIPMAGGVDSLNVAAASAVAFWATRMHR